MVNNNSPIRDGKAVNKMTNNESNTQFNMLENEQNKPKRMKKEGFIKTNSENEFFLK